MFADCKDKKMSNTSAIVLFSKISLQIAKEFSSIDFKKNIYYTLSKIQYNKEVISKKNVIFGQKKKEKGVNKENEQKEEKNNDY